MLTLQDLTIQVSECILLYGTCHLFKHEAWMFDHTHQIFFYAVETWNKGLFDTQKNSVWCEYMLFDVHDVMQI